MSGRWIGCGRWMRSWRRTAEPLVAGRSNQKPCLAGRDGLRRGRCKYVHVARSPHPCGSRPCAAHPDRPLTVSVGVQPRKRKKKSKSGSRRCARSSVSTKVDTYQQQCNTQSRQIAEICRRRGAVGLRGVSRMDAATKPPWMGLRRPRTPTAPRLPPGSQHLILTLTLLWLAAGAGQQPCKENPTLSTGAGLLPAPAAGTAP